MPGDLGRLENVHDNKKAFSEFQTQLGIIVGVKSCKIIEAEKEEWLD
jgi:hypothetical protein